MRQFLTAALLVTAALAQTTTRKPAHHTMTSVDTAEIIDGAKTPTLIPDVAAWRLWLISITTDDTKRPELSTARRHAFLHMAGVAEDEMVLADEALSHFRGEYDALIMNYNKSPHPSIKDFWAQRDALVQATQTSLSGEIAPASAAQLKNYINEEKKNMKVAKEAQ